MSRRRHKSAVARRAAARPRSTPTEPTRLRASDPADLLALIPYQLGFHPAESVVTMFLQSGRVLLTARVDLPAVTYADALAEELAGLARQHGASGVVLVGYGSDPPRTRAVLDRLTVSLGSAVGVAEALYVDAGRWWSLLDPPTGPNDPGQPYEVESHRVAAEAVYAGMTARGDRSELVALVVGPDPATTDRLAELARTLESDLDRLPDRGRTTAMEEGVQAQVNAADGTAPDEAALLRLALLARDLLLRDLAWAAITREEARAHVRLWTEVVRVSPPALASAPLCLLGLAGWINGDGALLNICVERVSLIDPGYSLGRLLADISAHALSPSLWDELGVDLRAELASMIR